MSELATLRSIARNEDGSFSVTFDAAGRAWQMNVKADDEGLEVEFDDDLAEAVELCESEDDELSERQMVLREIGIIADGLMESLARSGLLGDLAALDEHFEDDDFEDGAAEA